MDRSTWKIGDHVVDRKGRKGIVSAISHYPHGGNTPYIVSFTDTPNYVSYLSAEDLQWDQDFYQARK